MTILLGEPIVADGYVRWLTQQGSIFRVTWINANGERSSTESKSPDDIYKMYSFQTMPSLRGKAVRVTEHLPSESREPSVVLDLLDRIRELESTIQQVDDLHGGIEVEGVGTFDYCETCDREAPCPPSKALGDRK